MTSPTIQCCDFSFAFKTIRLQVLCLDDFPVHLSFSLEKHEAAKRWIQRHTSAICTTVNTTDHCFADILTGFFKGRRLQFPPQTQSPFRENGTVFQKSVWTRIAEIPYGETRTYGELAASLGNPKASRAVGQACNANPLALIVPCHRVTGASGLGGFAGGRAAKKFLLDLERQTLARDASNRS